MEPLPRIHPNNCPIRERTASGQSVGRCDFHAPGDVCPRHGLVDIPLTRYRETGHLTDEREWTLRWTRIGAKCWTAVLGGLGERPAPDFRIMRRGGWFYLERRVVTEASGPVGLWMPIMGPRKGRKRFGSREDAVEHAGNVATPLRTA
jgi:hypothetical protein